MLQSGVETLRGVGPARAAQLSKLGVRTVEDLLGLLPRDYEDYTAETPSPRCGTGSLPPCACACARSRRPPTSTVVRS